MHVENLIEMRAVQPTNESRVELGHGKKRVSKDPWDDPEA